MISPFLMHVGYTLDYLAYLDHSRFYRQLRFRDKRFHVAIRIALSIIDIVSGLICRYYALLR